MDATAVEAFRARYRAVIHPRYSGRLHALWIAVAGVSVVAVSVAQLHDVKALEWLVLVVALLLGNVGEYAIHVQLGHRKKRWAKLFYQRHTGDHHSFFTQANMQWQNPRDWRVVLFPAWLIIVVVALIGAPGAWLLNTWGSSNAAWLWLASPAPMCSTKPSTSLIICPMAIGYTGVCRAWRRWRTCIGYIIIAMT
ncbi:hypothetical protein DFR26_0470 [Paraperlucidibaca baekdonensis]|uniref:Fatty acid hydroxylase family protein n=1 Tax=Paraperlucidibaca baekdonensis TaxID=748120 RepID=A0A3E0H992_9GAMM|nr:hypothetical protein [Paraperlucidibaca baekdonensis]REH40271.1 hypothetical protein DFR26_0470 [Paraperlucidibaca baekdonensis]